MTHGLDMLLPALLIAGCYLTFGIRYQMAMSKAGRRSRAGHAGNYLSVVFILCAITGYVALWPPLAFLQGILIWFLAASAVGLVVTDAGTRMGRAMDYEALLSENDRLRAEIEEAKRSS